MIKIQRFPFFMLICFLIFNIQNAFAQQTQPVGSISKLYGQVELTRNGSKVESGENTPVHLNDRIETGEDGFTVIVFNDGTSIEIASDSGIEINEFVYNPGERKSKFNIIKGAIKSEISKIQSQNSTVEFQTRNAVAGVKGTVLYINADDDFFGVRVGRVYVRGLQPGSSTVYVSGGYYTTIVNGVPLVPRIMTRSMLNRFENMFDYRRYLPSEVNDVIRKTPFNLKKPKLFK